MAFLHLGEKLKALASRSAAQPRPTDSEDAIGASALFNTIEGEIIPRLMLAHRAPLAPTDGQAPPAEVLSEQDHELFLQCVLRDSASSAHSYVEALLQRGVARDDLFLNLLATCARRLGEMWERDLCDFTDVTIGLCRLHEIVRKNAANANHSQPTVAGDGPRILLATACGDQHVFGIVIIADFFRRAGWRVTSEPGATQEELAKILSEREFDVLGLSAACSVFADDIANEIKKLRAASRNKNMKVLAGGRLFAESPALVKKVGADAFADSAKTAAEIGKELLAASAAHC